MKQIINGKKYDTETADFFAQITYGEVIYRKKNGEFFTYSISTNEIIPRSEELIRREVETTCSVEQCEELFGEYAE
jgi:hypothetical protein